MFYQEIKIILKKDWNKSNKILMTIDQIFKETNCKEINKRIKT